MRIIYGNILDPSGTIAPYSVATITASSQSSETIPQNIAHPFRKLYWKTGTSTASEWIKFVFPTASPVTAIGIVDHNFAGGDTITIKANSSDSWGSPAFSQVITPAATMAMAVFTAKTYQYWRLDITKASAGVARQIGAIIIGSYYDTTQEPDYSGYIDQMNDPSVISESIGGQIYVEQRPQFKNFEAQWSAADSTMLSNIQTIFGAGGLSQPLVMQPQAAGELSDLFYCRMTEPLKRSVKGYDSSLRWALKLGFRELI